MRTSPQKIKIFGRGNQKLFKFSIWLIGQTECTALTLLSKTDWKSRLKRCNFWFPQPNILIFWREVLQRMYKTVVKLSEWEIFFSISFRFLSPWMVGYFYNILFILLNTFVSSPSSIKLALSRLDFNETAKIFLIKWLNDFRW